MGKVSIILLLTALIIYCLHTIAAEEIRLLDLEPNDAQNLIEKQDQTLKYAPKIENDVPAVRYLGQEPHNVLEDIYLAKQYHGQDGLGGYLYGYQVPDIAKNEHKKAGGDLRGAYNYVNGAGQEIKVEYWDDGTGFHQIDNVPKILPKQIDDSPEVKAAKDAFLKRWHEEAERNSHPVQQPQGAGSTTKVWANPPSYIENYQPHGDASSQQVNFVPQNNGGQYSQAQQQQYQPQGDASYQQPQYVPQYNGGEQYTKKPDPVYQPLPQTGATSQHAAYIPPSPQSNGVQQPQNIPIPYNLQEGASSQQANYVQSSSSPNGKYTAKESEEDVTGPPKGFFYAFDYPVGIITKDQGRALPSNGVALKNVYEENKERFSRQLAQGWSSNGGSQYLIN